MNRAKESEKKFNIDIERIEELDAKASRGILEGTPGKVTTGPGRPTLSSEPLQQVAFKEPQNIVAAIDRRAAQLGLRRSDYLRQLVENDLSCAGLA